MSDPATPQFGYRRRPIKLMDTQLKLDPMFMQGLPGWSVQTDLGQVVNLDLGLPTDWAFWQRFDEEHLRRCDVCLVLQADGCRESEGVRAEIALAKSYRKQVQYLELSTEAQL